MTDTTLTQVQYLTVAEVAGNLRVHPMTVYRMISRGDLAAIQVGRRNFRIPVDSYTAYVAQLRAAADARMQQTPGPIPGQTAIDYSDAT